VSATPEPSKLDRPRRCRSARCAQGSTRSPKSRVRQNSLTVVPLVAIVFAMCAAIRPVAALRPALTARTNVLLELWPCVTRWASSPVPFGAFVSLTVCSGCACDGRGLGGGMRWRWFSRQQSSVGGAKGSVGRARRTEYGNPYPARAVGTCASSYSVQVRAFQNAGG
jgi:hypothetical protein